MARYQCRKDAARARSRFFPKATTKQEEDVLQVNATTERDLQRQAESDLQRLREKAEVEKEKTELSQKKVPENSGKPKKRPVDKQEATKEGG